MTERSIILIVDDDDDILASCKVQFKRRFGEIITTNDPRNIPALLAQYQFDAILLDMNFEADDVSGKDGLHWLSRIMKIEPQAVVILITAFSSVDAAVEAMKLGAYDFVEKPWNNERLATTLTAAIKLRRSRQEAEYFRQTSRMLNEDIQRLHHPIIGQSDAIQELLAVLRRAAPTDANVLILGENGTGKELIARELHALSQRSDEAFISVDLSTIPGTLLESELFGHKKGAFTDAREDRMGRFQAADNGTFFLDEIGNLPLNLQPKLLTALENREVTPIGGKRPEAVDIRLVSATNASKEDLLDPKLFRPDLLYRFNTVEIQLPALRDRADDVPLLANAFVREYARKYNRHVESISDSAMELLMENQWPGNIRELRYSIERAIILADGDELGPQDFRQLAVSTERVPKHGEDNASPSTIERQPAAHQTLRDIERASIERVLDRHEGNVALAAKELGLTRTSLYRRIKKFGLQ
jgi:two-component system response regulator HydG